MFAKINFEKTGISLTLVTEEELGGTPFNLYRGQGGCDVLIDDVVLVEVRGMTPGEENSLVNMKMQFFNMKTQKDLRGVYLEAVINKKGELSLSTNLTRANVGIPKKLFQKLWGEDREPIALLQAINLTDCEYRQQEGVADHGETQLEKFISELSVQIFISLQW